MRMSQIACKRAVILTLIVTLCSPLSLMASVAFANEVPLYRDVKAPLEDRVEALLDVMTPEQMAQTASTPISMEWTLTNGDKTPRYGSGNEALHGAGKTTKDVTVFPQSIGLGSTWDKKLMKDVGAVVSDQLRYQLNSMPESSRRSNRALFTADVFSNPLAGRYEEGYGEDPYLTGTLGTAYASGLAGDEPNYWKTYPIVKHFLGYNHEWSRSTSSSTMSSRSMYEYGIPAFKKIVESGKTAGAMAAYNLVNGIPAHVHPLLQDLRKWAPNRLNIVNDSGGSTNLYNPQNYLPPGENDYPHAVAVEVIAGLDNYSNPGSPHPSTPAAIMQALSSGYYGFNIDHLRNVARNFMTMRIRGGEFDNAGTNLGGPYAGTAPKLNTDPDSKALALRAAEEQMVLLKNNGNVLPLNKNVGKLAVVGPLADQNLRDFYSPTVDISANSALAGIQTKIGADKVAFTNGADTIAWYSPEYQKYITAPPGGGGQLTADKNAKSSAETGDYALPDGSGNYVTPNEAFQMYDFGSGQYLFKSLANGKYVSGTTSGNVQNNNGSQGNVKNPTGMVDGDTWMTNTNYSYVTHEDGKKSLFGVNYTNNFQTAYNDGRYIAVSAGGKPGLEANVTQSQFKTNLNNEQGRSKFVEYKLVSGSDGAAAVSQGADYAIVVVGTNPLLNARETQDRPNLLLAPKQLELINATAKAKPGKTLVVIVSSYPLAVQTIQDNPDVAAIIQTSHAGAAAGDALANVLFGDYAPAGRLTANWLKDESSLPKLATPYPNDGSNPYTVDMMNSDPIASKLTYRYSDAQYTYPFGHGLSYTKFTYSRLNVSENVYGGATFQVSFDIKNTGSVHSDEVAQIYTHSKNSAYGDRVAKKQLVAFERVKDIMPGETRRVTLTVDPKDFAVWDVLRKEMIVESGKYDLFVGPSSNRSPLEKELKVKGQTIGSLDLKSAKNAWEYYTDNKGVEPVEYSFSKTMARHGGYYAVTSSVYGGYIGFNKVKLSGITGIELDVASNQSASEIEVHADSPNGPVLGKVTFGSTGGAKTYQLQAGKLKAIFGNRNLYLVIKNSGVSVNTIKLLRASKDECFALISQLIQDYGASGKIPAQLKNILVNDIKEAGEQFSRGHIDQAVKQLRDIEGRISSMTKNLSELDKSDSEADLAALLQIIIE